MKAPFLPRLVSVSLLYLFLVAPVSAQSQVGSAENPRDCKGVDFGSNIKDNVGGCCLSGEMQCQRCGYQKSECEQQFGCFTSVRNLGCGCGNPAPVCGKCGHTKTECEQSMGCGTTATNQGCGCGKPAPGPCGCTACPPQEPPKQVLCNHAPVHLYRRWEISLHFGTGNNDSNGVLNDPVLYNDICQSVLGATSKSAVVPYEIHTSTFSSPGNNSICAYKPNSSTEKHCVNAKGVGNPAHIAQIKCRCA